MADVDDRWHSFRPRAGVKPCVTHTSSKGPLYPTTRHGIGKRWAARWRDEGKKQRVRSFEKKGQADTFLDTVRADLARGVYIDPGAGKVTVRAYAAQWLAAQTFDPASRERIGQQIKTQIAPVLGDLELRVLLPSTVQGWVSGLSKTHAASTVRGAVSTLSTILVAAIEDRMIQTNPCRSRAVRLPAMDKKKIVPWTIDRARAVEAALPDRYGAMVPVGAGLGLRQGEVFGLAVEDVEFLAGVVRVDRQVKFLSGKLYFDLPKRGKTRTVPLPESVALALAAHLQRFPAVEVTLPWLPTGKPVTASLCFTTPNGTGLMRPVFNPRVWRPALREAGVPAVRENGTHALRHLYASALLADGVDVNTLAEYLGHENAAITLRYYCHLMPTAPDRVKSAIDRAFSVGCVPDVRHATR